MQLRNAAIVVYSLVVAASSIPAFRDIPNTVLIPYYVVIPGYCFSLLAGRSETLSSRIFYTFGWSLALLCGVVALESLNTKAQNLPLSILIPLMTLVVFVFDYFHGR